MTDSFIQLSTDGTGKQLDTVIVNMGVGTTQVHREKMVVADPLSTSAFATVTSSAGLQVASTLGRNPWSSAPGFNVPMVSASSGLVQMIYNATTSTPELSAGLNLVTGTTQGAVRVTQSSGIVSLSSVHTVTATAGTNPWSSAPGFNMPIVSVSSGLVQVSGTPLINVVGTSSGVAVVTTSGGLQVQATGPMTISGTVTVLSASSGLVQISGTPTILSASSGLVQISGTVGLSTAVNANLVAIVTSSAGNLVATTSQGLMVQQTTSKIVPVLAASSGLVSIDLWQATSRISPTFVTATTISKVSSAPGNLFFVMGLTTSTGGVGATSPSLIRLYNASTSNVVMNTSVVGILQLGLQASSQGDVSQPTVNFGPIGMGFSAACSFDIVQITTSTATVTSTSTPAYVTFLYSTN